MLPSYHPYRRRLRHCGPNHPNPNPNPNPNHLLQATRAATGAAEATLRETTHRAEVRSLFVTPMAA